MSSNLATKDDDERQQEAGGGARAKIGEHDKNDRDGEED